MTRPVPLKDSSPRPRLGEFLPSIIIEPISAHKVTIVFLHGRGWDANKFSTALLPTPTSDEATFREALPNARFVFPTAPLMRASKYRRAVIHQWYEGTGDWEPESRGEMRPSIEHIHSILYDEIEKVGGDARRVVLAGFSQGCAMALICSLLWDGEPLGAVAGMCGFMPLAASLMSTLNGSHNEDPNDDGIVFGEEEDGVFDDGSSIETRTPLRKAVEELCEEAELEPVSLPTSFPFLSTPMFMGHGLKDQEVDVSHGKEAGALLENMGVSVSFHTYPELGHWHGPEMLQDVVLFLRTRLDI